MEEKKKKTMMNKISLDKIDSKTKEEVEIEEDFFEITPNNKIIEIEIDINNIFSNEHKRNLTNYLKNNKVDYIIYKIFTHNNLVNKNKIKINKDEFFIESRYIIKINKEITLNKLVKKIYEKLIEVRNEVVIIH